MFERATIALLDRVVDGEHRAMKSDHPRALDNRIEQKCQVGKSDEGLGCEGEGLEIQQRKNPSGAIASARDENRTDVGVSEKCLQLLGPLAI